MKLCSIQELQPSLQTQLALLLRRCSVAIHHHSSQSLTAGPKGVSARAIATSFGAISSLQELLWSAPWTSGRLKPACAQLRHPMQIWQSCANWPALLRPAPRTQRRWLSCAIERWEEADECRQ